MLSLSGAHRMSRLMLIECRAVAEVRVPPGRDPPVGVSGPSSLRVLPSTRAGRSRVDDDPGGVHGGAGVARRRVGRSVRSLSMSGITRRRCRSWLKAGGPPAKRSTPVGGADRSMSGGGPGSPGCWRRTRRCRRRRSCGSSPPRGSTGRIRRLTRYLRSVRGPSRGAGAARWRCRSRPGPAEEFQFDWSDCNRVGAPLGVGRRVALLRDGAVLVPPQAVVVRPVDRPAAHLGGSGRLVRRPRRGAGGGAHRPDGSARPVPWPQRSAGIRRCWSSPATTASR